VKKNSRISPLQYTRKLTLIMPVSCIRVGLDRLLL